MQVGDLVWHIVRGRREQWGVGIVTEIHSVNYSNHIPYISVFWAKPRKETRNHTQAYIENINEVK